MRPPICSVCGATSASDGIFGRGDWVRFADYRPLLAAQDGQPSVVGHPHGEEWFCRHHLRKARALADQPAKMALAQLGAH